jgi:hypothetical protein
MVETLLPQQWTRQRSALFAAQMTTARIHPREARKQNASTLALTTMRRRAITQQMRGRISSG